MIDSRENVEGLFSLEGWQFQSKVTSVKYSDLIIILVVRAETQISM